MFLRLYDSAGNPRGDQFTSTAPTFEYDEHVNPEVAIDDKGEFVVVWEGVGYYPYPDEPSYQGINESVFGRVHDSSGATKGGQFQADIYEVYTQGEYGYLDVARAASGDSFVVVWYGQGPTVGSGYYAYPTYGIHGRRFLFDRGASAQFGVAVDVDEAYATDPQVAMDPAGNFTVVWYDLDTEGIAARRFSKEGLKLGDPFPISEGEGSGPSVDADPAGNLVVVWRDEYHCRGRVLDALGNRRGGEFDVGCSSFFCGYGYGCGPDVAAVGGENFVVTWANDESGSRDDKRVFARRFAMEPLTEVLLPGKSLLIRDGPLDLPQSRKATWSARGLNLASPARGSEDDPRCNGDPGGTLKASIRFFSDRSGADTGELGLPCDGWSATGPSSSDPLALQGFKYKDPKLARSLCTSVVLRRTRVIKAICRGMSFDLASGVDQGTVHALLTLGRVRFCTAFPASGADDGSDGLRFQGEDSPAPVDCPSP